ncbi:MAG: hypothetical protein MI919_28255, partial [Holophagales bacterium]|nr:hypothetical protein [Holophagales bacterium]
MADEEVLLPQLAAPDPERPPMMAERFGEGLEIVESLTQVELGVAHQGMVGAVGQVMDLVGLLEESEGLFRPARLGQSGADVVEDHRHVGMLIARGLPIELLRLPVVLEGGLDLPEPQEGRAEVDQGIGVAQVVGAQGAGVAGDGTLEKF